MPSVPKNAGQHTPAKAGSLAFEEALKKLEAIVTKMETEDLPLETLLAKYEEGTRLARTCQEKLAEDTFSGCVFVFRSRSGTANGTLLSVSTLNSMLEMPTRTCEDEFSLSIHPGL